MTLLPCMPNCSTNPLTATSSHLPHSSTALLRSPDHTGRLPTLPLLPPSCPSVSLYRKNTEYRQIIVSDLFPRSGSFSALSSDSSFRISPAYFHPDTLTHSHT